MNSSWSYQLRKLECFSHALVFGEFSSQSKRFRGAVALRRIGCASLSLESQLLHSCESYLVRLD